MVDVLVIGAGPAGLCSGYYLQRAGVGYQIVDRADHLGSTWAQLYPSLKLNTASFVSHMPDQRMPLRYGLLPSGKQYYEHLINWAKKHPLNVQLSVEVNRVEAENDTWRATLNGTPQRFRAVVLATGRFSNPFIPSVPGRAEFQAFKSTPVTSTTRQTFAGNGS